MKTRNDFVSNSSSCSFVINDISALVEVLRTVFHDVDIPYDFDNDITCYVYTHKNEWANTFEKITGQKPDYTPSYAENDICWMDAIHTDFINVAKSPENLENAEQIVFQCEDYGSGPIYLKMLYEFFERMRLNPDAADSENEFLTPEENFFRILSEYGKNENTRTDRTA